MSSQCTAAPYSDSVQQTDASVPDGDQLIALTRCWPDVHTRTVTQRAGLAGIHTNETATSITWGKSEDYYCTKYFLGSLNTYLPFVTLQILFLAYIDHPGLKYTISPDRNPV